MNKGVFSLLTVLALGLSITLSAGCGSTEPSRFYLLSPLPEAEAEEGVLGEGLAIVIGPVTLPEYLNRPQMVMKGGDNEIRLAEFDRWAEPFRDNFTRVVAENVSVLLSTANVSVFPKRVGHQDYRIEISVLRFDKEEGGKVTLSVRCILFGEGGRDVLKMRKFNIIGSAGREDDFRAMVFTMSGMVAELSRGVAETIEELEAKKGTSSGGDGP